MAGKRQLKVGDAVSAKIAGKSRKARVLQVPVDNGAVLVETTEGDYVSTFVATADVSGTRSKSSGDDAPPPSGVTAITGNGQDD